ncbi:MAG TPA: pyridoxamine 5'-phosphate oxidase [Candidatus Limnocylindrales bacterium]|nr:pyridoxamine 5'-phosphate oxidase [Candidatus Limnocylindrales bacterium]
MADPIARFQSWFRQAVQAGAVLPEAMVVATADTRGRPSARWVLLKEAGPTGFVFYTNANSRKGREMAANPYAALVFYWEVTGRQIRIEGRLRELDAAAADAYWQERPPASRIASAVSNQSAPIESRAVLMKRYRELAARFPGGSVPRPAHWKGYRVVPDSVEFWERAEPRLHKRELFTRTRGGWKSQILQP